MRRALVFCSVMTLIACGDDKGGDDGDGSADGADGTDGTPTDGGDGTGDGGDGTGDGAGDGSGDGTPDGDFDCQALTTYYTTSCPDHVEITDDATACPLLHAGLNDPTLKAQRAMNAAICAGATESCDDTLICFEDKDGISASTHEATVSGQASYDGETFPLEATGAWAIIRTKPTGEPNDLVVLFSIGGKPWYFKLHDFAGRAGDDPFVVDLERPVKLENADENLEIASGTVTVTAFARDGAFDVRASASDVATGEGIDLQVKGTFTAAEGG